MTEAEMYETRNVEKLASLVKSVRSLIIHDDGAVNKTDFLELESFVARLYSDTVKNVNDMLKL